jgi:hypothetical protein
VTTVGDSQLGSVESEVVLAQPEGVHVCPESKEPGSHEDAAIAAVVVVVDLTHVWPESVSPILQV